MHYGISTICPSWFRSYITNRYQEVILHQPFTFLFFKSDHGHNNIIYLHIYNDINQILTPKFCKKKTPLSIWKKVCLLQMPSLLHLTSRKNSARTRKFSLTHLFLLYVPTRRCLASVHIVVLRQPPTDLNQIKDI